MELCYVINRIGGTTTKTSINEINIYFHNCIDKMSLLRDSLTPPIHF